MNYEFTIPTGISPAELPYIVADKSYFEARKSLLEDFFCKDSQIISYQSALGTLKLDLATSKLAAIRQSWLSSSIQISDFCREIHFEKQQIQEKKDSLQVLTNLRMVRADWGFLGFMAMMIPAEISIRIVENWTLSPTGIYRGKREIKASGVPISAVQNWEYLKTPEGDSHIIKFQLGEIPFFGSWGDGEKLSVIGYNLLTLEEEIKQQWWEMVRPSMEDRVE